MHASDSVLSHSIFGRPNDMPIIKGCDQFKGIALFDVDPHIPVGAGQQWDINQNECTARVPRSKGPKLGRVFAPTTSVV